MTFFTLLIIMYFYSGQPIMSSFASTSMILLFVTGWITVTIIDAESLQEKQLLFTQLKSKSTYLTNKLIFSILLILPLGIVAIIYPIITFRFEHIPNVIEIVIGIYSHIITIIGALITTLLKTIPKLSYKFVWLIMMLIFLFSILRVVIIEAFSISSYVLLDLPTDK